ncbi:unnamed protein product [Sphagnum jensenii]|uniref:Uncharacterized protein n=1 Tax=Sphagnum jensenii TaxID=128206 RepID=A0ABP1BRQ0_9BRYO
MRKTPRPSVQSFIVLGNYLLFVGDVGRDRGVAEGIRFTGLVGRESDYIAVLDWYSWSAELPSLIRNKNHQQEYLNPQSIDACVHSRREKALLKSLGATKQSEENRNVL